MILRVATAVLTAGWLPLASLWAGSSWLHNPRQLTERAVERYQQGDYGAARENAEEALALAPADPRLHFNAGTAGLAAGQAEAVSVLERAAALARDPALRADAWYNLGNARLQAGELAAAIAAYQNALRAAPDHEAAKFNLELAQRRQQQQPPPPSPAPPPPNDPQAPPPPPPPQQGQQQSFEQQPDMSPDQAAALLEAVDNLERRQQQEKAREQAGQRGTGARDW